MARKRFHGLKRIKIRQTWNKYNLYNLSRLRLPPTSSSTFYQQKWAAKSATRAYHGEQIKEKHWERMFRPRLQSVIPMDHRYLAENDGSELAAGRGSGKERPLSISNIKFGKNTIPYMNMTYAPAERRLDMAVWRSLFASSARQARQFVIHGKVTVNGQKMPYPGYLLNPGDMFQVEPDRVLYATGAPKDIHQVRTGRKLRKAQRRQNKSIRPQKTSLKQKLAAMKEREEAAGVAKTVATRSQPVTVQYTDIEEIRQQRKLDLKEIIKKVEVAQEDKKNRPGAKKKIELRAFAREVKKAMALVNRKDAQKLDDELNTLLGKLSLVTAPKTKEVAPEAAKEEAETRQPTAEEQRALREAIARARENPIDESKPYATPWTPRPYMSAFAFIPRYLEVNHNICAAVYLRHPVARPHLAEVPTPFPPDVQQLAFNWYLRRR